MTQSSSSKPGLWPSLEEQLRASGAVHGSELERLIKANQDVSMLRAEEHEQDGIDLPLWLRVHYRKSHPDQPPAAAGPVGDYPEALENLHEWMKKNQNLKRG